MIIDNSVDSIDKILNNTSEPASTSAEKAYTLIPLMFGVFKKWLPKRKKAMQGKIQGH